MKIVFINGKIGAGKTTCAKHLYDTTLNSAFIDGDYLLKINPFSPTEEHYLVTAKNIVSLIKSYKINFKIDIVFVSWLLKNNDVYKEFSNSLADEELFFYYLSAPDKLLKERITKDIEGNLRYPDEIFKTDREFFKQNHEIVENIVFEETIIQIKKKAGLI